LVGGGRVWRILVDVIIKKRNLITKNMDFHNAEEQFNDNFRQFGNAQTEPEKFNLYAGLANLARGLRVVQSELEDIRNRVARIEQTLNQRGF